MQKGFLKILLSAWALHSCRHLSAFTVCQGPSYQMELKYLSCLLGLQAGQGRSCPVLWPHAGASRGGPL